jgi:hypothetical protein
MNQMKPLALAANLDRPGAESERKQLPPRDNPVLSFGEPGNGLVASARAAFTTYSEVDAALVAHAADGLACVRARGAHFEPKASSGTQKRPQPAVAASGFDPFK